MKATAVGKEVKPSEIIGQSCATCGKKLQAPWGRLNHGKDWVCSSQCHAVYQENIPHLVVPLRKLLAG